MDYKKLQGIIGYKFNNEDLLFQAMMHSSYANERQMDKILCNERVEFLGDAVLELVASKLLFKEFPNMPEGDMTKKRASLVCEPSLAFSAREIHLQHCVLLGKGEEATAGRERDSIISDALESLIGAIYLDSGYDEAEEFILRFVLNDLDKKALFHDSKTALQEIVQSEYDCNVEYRLIKSEGPDHNKTFESEVTLHGEVMGSGTGKSKKQSEQKAAFEAIMKLQGR